MKSGVALFVLLDQMTKQQIKSVFKYTLSRFQTISSAWQLYYNPKKSLRVGLRGVGWGIHLL